jgi:uncharacterized membrane protein (Fun14 family)
VFILIKVWFLTIIELIIAGVTSADYERIKNITKTAAEKIK